MQMRANLHDEHVCGFKILYELQQESQNGYTLLSQILNADVESYLTFLHRH